MSHNLLRAREGEAEILDFVHLDKYLGHEQSPRDRLGGCPARGNGPPSMPSFFSARASSVCLDRLFLCAFSNSTGRYDITLCAVPQDLRAPNEKVSHAHSPFVGGMQLVVYIGHASATDS